MSILESQRFELPPNNWHSGNSYSLLALQVLCDTLFLNSKILIVTWFKIQNEKCMMNDLRKYLKLDGN